MEEKQETQKVLSISEWATSSDPYVSAIEVFSLQELADTLNTIFGSGLFLLRTEYNQTEFFKSWEILYGNESAKILYLESDRITINRKRLKKNLQMIEKANERGVESVEKGSV